MILFRIFFGLIMVLIIPNVFGQTCGDGNCEAAETYYSCPGDCHHPADTNDNGCIDLTEVMLFVQCWKSTNYQLPDYCSPEDLIQTIELWKRGCEDCGNNNIDQGEDCDTVNLNSETCESLGIENGILACDRYCLFDTSRCVTQPGYPRVFSSWTLYPDQEPEIIQNHTMLNGVITGPTVGYVPNKDWPFEEIAEIKSISPDKPVILLKPWGYNDFRRIGELGFTPDPRHWLYAVGSDTNISYQISPSDTQIYVEDCTNFAVGDNAAMVAIDSTGELDWSLHEEINITGLDTNIPCEYVEVTRGLYGTSAQNYGSQQARIMLHEMSIYDWTGYPRWEFNPSPMAPDGADGYGPAHHLARYFASMSHDHPDMIDGFQLDVAKWTAWGEGQGPDKRGVLLDCDLDGIGDDCYDNGVNTYAVGIMDLFRLIREGGDDFEGLGDELILNADAQRGIPQQAVPFLNGIEIEKYPGYANPQHKLLAVSFDQLDYWSNNAGIEPHISYSKIKQTVEAFKQPGCALDLTGTNSLYRVGLVSALLTGSYFVFIPNLHQHQPNCGPNHKDGPVFLDEYYAGSENRWGYLGQPVGPAEWILDNLNTANLIGDGDFESELGNWELTVNGGASADGPVLDSSTAGNGQNSLKVDVTGIGAVRPKPSRIMLKSEPFQAEAGKTYTLRLWTKAENDYAAHTGDARYGSARRQLNIYITHPDATGAIAISRLNTGPEWREHTLTLIPDTTRSDAYLRIDMAFDTGPVWIDDIRLQEGCGMVLYREFEGGLAVMNGCPHDPVDIDIDSLFPDDTYHRIDGVQDPIVNDGSAVGSILSLPQLDAIILLKD